MKVLIPFYSTYGHIYQMALAAAEGVKEVAGAEALVRRVPETLPKEVLAMVGSDTGFSNMVKDSLIDRRSPFCWLSSDD